MRAPRKDGLTRRIAFGQLEQKASGAFRAYYVRHGIRHTPGHTFATQELAENWLTAEKAAIDSGTWTPPADRRTEAEKTTARSSRTFGAYALAWIERRTTTEGRPLAPKTAHEYRGYVAGRLADLAARPLVDITREDVDDWWQANGDKLTARQHAYMFAKSVFKDAVSRDLIPSNPCQVANASRRARVTPKRIRSQLVVSLRPEDVSALAEANESRWRAMLLLVAWCGLRPGEAFALTRGDIRRGMDAEGLPRYLLSVHKGVSDGEDGRRAVAGTKTSDSIRTVPLPPHLAPLLDQHEAEWAQPGDDGLLFPSTNPHMAYATNQQVMGTYPSRRKEPGRRPREREASGFAAARLAIGRPTLRIYDLRHWARGVWNSTGLDFASVEMLLGHTLPMVTGTYAHLDLDHVWPYAVKVSELSGWQRPTSHHRDASTVMDASALSPRLLAAMTPEQLRATLAAFTDDQLAALVPTLPPEVLARLVASDTGNAPAVPDVVL